MSNIVTKPAKRLSRETWLDLALEVVAREGQAKLRIHELVRHLGVTRGSFYWHFESRDDFVRQLAEHWATISTAPVVDRISEMNGDASARLLALMELITNLDFAKYDLAMRSWAVQEPAVAEVVREVDRARLGFVRSLFRGMGFDHDEARMRARTVLGYQSLEDGIFFRQSKAERLADARRRHAMLTRP